MSAIGSLRDRAEERIGSIPIRYDGDGSACYDCTDVTLALLDIVDMYEQEIGLLEFESMANLEELEIIKRLFHASLKE